MTFNIDLERARTHAIHAINSYRGEVWEAMERHILKLAESNPDNAREVVLDALSIEELAPQHAKPATIALLIVKNSVYAEMRNLAAGNYEEFIAATKADIAEIDRPVDEDEL